MSIEQVQPAVETAAHVGRELFQAVGDMAILIVNSDAAVFDHFMELAQKNPAVSILGQAVSRLGLLQPRADVDWGDVATIAGYGLVSAAVGAGVGSLSENSRRGAVVGGAIGAALGSVFGWTLNNLSNALR